MSGQSNIPASSIGSSGAPADTVPAGILFFIDELKKLDADVNSALPSAVRIIARLESFDASESIIHFFAPKTHETTPSQDAMDESMGEGSTGSSAAAGFHPSPSLSSSYGVAVFSHHNSSIAVDTSLLHSIYAIDSATSSLQFELNHLYCIIGDLMSVDEGASTAEQNNQTKSTRCSRLYIRARICRELDARFDLALYEDTVKLRRKFENKLQAK